MSNPTQVYTCFIDVHVTVGETHRKEAMGAINTALAGQPTANIIDNDRIMPDPSISDAIHTTIQNAHYRLALSNTIKLRVDILSNGSKKFSIHDCKNGGA